MNNLPEVIFHQPSLEHDALRLLFTAHKLATGQYQYHNWLISPTMPKLAPPNLIIFPDLPAQAGLPYSTIPQFWEQATHDVTPTTPPTAPTNLITQLANLISTGETMFSPILLSNYQSLQQEWNKISRDFWITFFSILPDYQSKLKAINVYPTRYGTTKSFSLLDPKTTTLNIYLRLDQNISSLIDGVVSGTIRRDLQINQNLTWTETEAVKDTFLLTTPLASFAPNYHSTLLATRSTDNKQARQDSLQYLRHLSLDSTNHWQIDPNNTISYHDQPLTHLTQAQTTILTALIHAPDHILSQHELATALYPNPDKFSLWGLAKAIERLRTKLAANNLPAHLIQTNRNQGYSLFSTPTITKPDDQTF